MQVTGQQRTGTRTHGVKVGISRKDDEIPQRVKKVPDFGKYATVPESAIQNYDAMLEEYYIARGWDLNGVPKPEKLRELGLNWIKQ
ncbi:MAG: aldehyde ferredoxin oxidoreductase C-terminal domain-containing protein [Athalassotoga sp.]|uniref:aldehyde ferredoxin oxidoreductase C-terminal domain-containing protein n=1 Tax=Athalassotoga sp. TaxID=2022597 RepID=UPI003D008FB4